MSIGKGRLRSHDVLKKIKISTKEMKTREHQWIRESPNNYLPQSLTIPHRQGSHLHTKLADPPLQMTTLSSCQLVEKILCLECDPLGDYPWQYSLMATCGHTVA